MTEQTKAPKAKLGKTEKGEPLHFSVAAIIERDGKYLMIDRKNPPFGFACIAGHIDEGEEVDKALIREVWEESGLIVLESRLIAEEVLDWNQCSKGVGIHHWHVFEVKFSGKPVWNQEETKSIGWYTPEEIKKLELEPVWKYWLEKLKII